MTMILQKNMFSASETLMKLSAFCIAIVAAASFILSCNKDNAVMYNNVTMGFLSDDSRIVTDDGNIYEVVAGKTVEGIDPQTRVLVTCDILNRTGKTENQYDVRLKSIEVPVYGQVADSADVKDEEWPDAVSVSDAWISGGYLNLYCVWIGHRDSSVEHGIMLVHDTPASEDADTVSFRLVHNARGEGFSRETQTAENLTTVYKTATFPIGNYISGRNVTVKLSWIWHKTSGMYIYPETEPYSITCDL